MKDFFEQLEDLASQQRQFRMSPERKDALRQNLVFAISGKTAAPQPQSIPQQQTGSFFAIFKIQTFKFMLASTLVALLLFVGVGVSFAAQNSLPGDLLYPVKVDVNEQVRGFLATSPQAKADLDVTLAQTRLEEADKLAVSGKLTPALTAGLQQRLDDHISDLSNHISQVKDAHGDAAAATVASDFESSLSVQNDILSTLQQNSSDGDKSSVTSLVTTVQKKLSNARDSRTKFEDSVSSSENNSNAGLKVLASSKLQAASNAAFAADAYISKLNLGNEAENAVRQRLELAKQLVSEGQDKLGNGSFGQAFNLANQAARTVNEAQDLAKAQSDLRINLHLEDDNAFKIKGASDNSGRNRRRQDVQDTNQSDGASNQNSSNNQNQQIQNSGGGGRGGDSGSLQLQFND